MSLEERERQQLQQIINRPLGTRLKPQPKSQELTGWHWLHFGYTRLRSL